MDSDSRKIMYDQLFEVVNGVKNILNPLIELLQNEDVPRVLRDHIDGYQRGLSEFFGIRSILDEDDFEKAINGAKLVGIYANSVTVNLVCWKALQGNQQDLEQLREFAQNINYIITNEPVKFKRPITIISDQKIEKAKFVSLDELAQQIRVDVESVGSRLELVKKQQEEVERSVTSVGEMVENKFQQFEHATHAKLGTIEQVYKDAYDKLKQEHEEARRLLKIKDKNLDDHIGLLTRKIISGGYMRSAVKEEKIANKFRTGAIVMMVLVATYVVGTIAHMEIYSLDPKVVGLRTFAAVFFSFVVGYFVRQSSVHRMQSQKHFQTALDLKAIDSYALDLPEEIRNSLKQGIAEKIFVPKEVHAAIDSDGFGASEVVSKLLNSKGKA